MDLSFRGYHLTSASVSVSCTLCVLGPRCLLHPHRHFKTLPTFLLYCSHGKNTGVVCRSSSNTLATDVKSRLTGKDPDAGKD